MSVTGFICGFSGVLLYHGTYMIYLTSILVQKKKVKKKNISPVFTDYNSHFSLSTIGSSELQIQCRNKLPL